MLPLTGRTITDQHPLSSALLYVTLWGAQAAAIVRTYTSQWPPLLDAETHRRMTMSRAINVTATQAEVQARAAASGVSISAIETIPAGGTRVVFTHIADAELMRRMFADEMIAGTIVRTPWVQNG